MTNKEFYGDKLMAAALYRGDGCRVVHELKYGKSCYGKACCDCEFATVESVEKWLNAEHGEPEPPLLENGDGLKPGDWIMVRDSETCDWDKRRFAFYCADWFYCYDTDTPFGDRNAYIYGWTQARLPMEGE